MPRIQPVLEVEALMEPLRMRVGFGLVSIRFAREERLVTRRDCTNVCAEKVHHAKRCQKIR